MVGLLLGPPQDKTVTMTVDQARAELQKDEMKQCEEVGASFHSSSTLAIQEVARCHQQVPGRVLMRMTQVPVDGIIQRTRFDARWILKLHDLRWACSAGCAPGRC
jgi:hypothetical protein